MSFLIIQNSLATGVLCTETPGTGTDKTIPIIVLVGKAVACKQKAAILPAINYAFPTDRKKPNASRLLYRDIKHEP